MILFHLLLHTISRFCGKICWYLIQIVFSRNHTVPCTSNSRSPCPCLVLPLNFRIVEAGTLSPLQCPVILAVITVAFNCLLTICQVRWYYFTAIVSVSPCKYPNLHERNTKSQRGYVNGPHYTSQEQTHPCSPAFALSHIHAVSLPVPST